MSAKTQEIALDDVAEIMEIEADVDTAIANLAALSPVEYELKRVNAAKDLGMRAPALDDFVKQKRRETGLDGNDSQQGRPVEIGDTEPWHEPVNGQALLEDIVAAITRYVVLPDDQALAVGLWCIQTHCFRDFGIAPRLFIKSPVKRCGKSTLLRVIEKMLRRPFMTESPSTATIYRVVESYQPSLIFDEADTFINDDPQMAGNLNAGYLADGVAHRCQGDDNAVRAFSCFSPLAIASIGSIPDPLADRSVRIVLQRRQREPIDRLRIDRRHHLEDFARKAQRWAADNHSELMNAFEDPAMPDSLGDRDQDNWRPLIAIADTIGGDFGELARQAAISLCQSENPDDDVPSIMVLRDLYQYLAGDFDRDFVMSSTLVEHLATLEHRPWPEWRNGKPLTTTSLSRLLGTFGIKPGQRRQGASGGLRGYNTTQIVEAYETYGRPQNDTRNPAPSAQSATTLQFNKINGLQQNQNATTSNSVAVQKSTNPLKNNDCSVVAVRNGGGSPYPRNPACETETWESEL